MKGATHFLLVGFVGLAAHLLLFLLPTAAHAQVIYQENFENGASGWSDNRTETHPAFSRYLGRFSGSPNQTSRTFSVPEGSQSLVIAFDFYRFDSWDDTAQWGFDRFQVDVNGTQIFSLPFAPAPSSLTGTNGNASWEFVPVGPYSNQAHGGWQDQRYRVIITIANPPTSVSFTLRTAVNQSTGDESGGFDNFRVEAIPHPPNVSVSKASRMERPGAFHIPGELVVYTIDVTSTGGALDLGSLRLVDFLPDDVTLFSGNFGGSGSPVRFFDLSSPQSGVTCCSPSNLAFSNSASGPIQFNYSPNGGNDPAVTAVAITPGGRVRQGTASPVMLRFELLVTIE